MSFEKLVIELVTKTFSSVKASFYYGTLFAKCNEAEAAKLETQFLDNFGFPVIVSKVGNEFAFDFV
jgi:hypothetical protein